MATGTDNGPGRRPGTESSRLASIPDDEPGSEQYDDQQLANIASGLSKTMITALDGDPWPHASSIKALRSRGLMLEPGWLPTSRGQAVMAYIKRTRAS